MATLAVELKRAETNGDHKVNGFSGAVRSLENPGLEVGDTFVIPANPDVYVQKIGQGDNANTVEYIWVTLDGTENVKRFYPSTFTKSRSIYEDGVNGGLPKNTGVRVNTLGTAADEYRKHATVAEGMAALAGKKVRVTKIDTIKTLRYGFNTTQNTQIPTIDFVD